MSVPAPADLARASLALARRFAAGGTLWCLSPATPSHASHVAVEFVHPVIVGKRALPAVAVPDPDPTPVLRSGVAPGDVVVAIAGADDPVVADVVRRAPAWGAETVWIGAGPRPEPGAATYVLWVDDADAVASTERFVRIYHLLWELTHVCFEHPGLLVEDPAEAVCITCSDEATLVEVVAMDGDEAVVRAPWGRERVDTGLVDGAEPGALLLVHAGTAIARVGGVPA